MSKKAVKIDLSTFFNDERKMTFILIDPNWKSVECLQKRIEYLFGVESVRFLSDGYFLPPQESIEIVKFCNDLKAFVPKDALEKRKKKKSKKSKNTEKSLDEDEEAVNNDETSTAKEELINDTHMKRKYSHVSKTVSNQAKRSKSSNTLSEITSTSEQIPLSRSPSSFLQEDIYKELKSKKSKTKKSNVSTISSNHKEEKPMEECTNLESYSDIRVNENVTNFEENTVVQRNSVNEPKKRLTSTPKEKKISEIVKDKEEKIFNDEMKTTVARHSSIPSSTFLNESKMLQQHSSDKQSINSPNPNNPFKRPKSNRAHIYFNETGEVVSPSTKSNTKLSEKKDKESKTIIIFRCPLSEITNGLQPQKPRIFNLKSKNVTKNQNKKQVVEIQEEIIIPPGLTENANKMQVSPSEEVKEKEQQTNIETTKVIEETDYLNEKSSLNNTSIDTQNTTIAKNNSNHDGESSGQNEETNVTTHSQNESQLQLTTANETSIMSVDCVDLSMDLDEDDKMKKIKRTPSKLKRNIQEKHDLTKDDDDDEDNNSTTSSDVEEISEIIDLNETEDNCEDTINNSTLHSTSLKDIKVDKILPFSTDMTDMPCIGDIIVFKIRYVNKKQQSVQTNYIAGKAEYINRRTKIIKIFVIDGFSELNHIPNQFICNLDDSQDCIKYIQIKLNDMVGPKLFPMS